MSLAKHKDVVEALPSDRTDQPLCIRVLPGRSRRDGAVADAHCLQPPTHSVPISCISVSDQVTRHFIPREGVGDLPSYPLRRRMIGNADRYNLPPFMVQDD